MESLQSVWKCDDDVLPDFDDDDDNLQSALVQPPSQEPFNDGKIDPSLHPGCSFYFRANDLDAAIQSAKKVKKTIRIRGKKKNKSNRNKLREMDPKVFVARTSCFLKEPKRHLIEAAVERLGIEVVHDLVLEVKTIEENGGQMNLDNKRRRTPGGVLWNVIRSRSEEDYKAIMTAGRSYEKQRKQRKQRKQQRQKHKMKETDMVFVAQPSTKRRRRRRATGSGVALPEAHATLWPSRLTQMEDIQSKVDPENSQMEDITAKVDPENSHTLNQVQSAWAEGVEKGKHISHLSDVEMFDDTIA